MEVAFISFRTELSVSIRFFVSFEAQKTSFTFLEFTNGIQGVFSMKKIKEPRMTNDASAKCSLFYLVDFQTSTWKYSQERVFGWCLAESIDLKNCKNRT